MIVAGIVPQSQVQTALFDARNRREHNKFGLSLNRLNLSSGMGKIAFTSEGIEKLGKLKCKKLSKRYTTRWDELLRLGS